MLFKKLSSNNWAVVCLRPRKTSIRKLCPDQLIRCKILQKIMIFQISSTRSFLCLKKEQDENLTNYFSYPLNIYTYLEERLAIRTDLKFKKVVQPHKKVEYDKLYFYMMFSHLFKYFVLKGLSFSLRCKGSKIVPLHILFGDELLRALFKIHSIKIS